MGAYIRLDGFLELYADEFDQRKTLYTRSHLSEEPLIPNVYEPIVCEPVEEDEPCRARSASPRLESGTSFSADLCIEHSRDPYSICQAAELVKTRGQRRCIEDGTKPAHSTQLSNRFNGNRDFNSQADKTPIKRRHKEGYLSQQRPDICRKPPKTQSRQSSLDDWRDAGDRLFGLSSRNRQ